MSTVAKVHGRPGPIAHRKNLFQRLWQSRWAYLFILVPMLLFVTFEVYPFLSAIWLSTVKWNLVSQPKPVGLDNYRSLFADRVFWIALKNSAFYGMVVVPGGLALSLFLAVLVFPLSKRLQTFYKMAFYLPSVASIVVVSMIWRWMYQPAFGLFNYFLSLVGIGPQQFLASSQQALPSIMVMSTFSNPVVGIGPALILILAAMNAIPQDFYDAAIIDGANAWQKFWHVTLPLVRSTILFLVIIGTIETLREFTAIYMMTSSSASNTLSGGGPNYSTTTVVYYIFINAFRINQFGIASAMAIVLFAIIFVIALVQFRMLRTDIEF